MYEKYPKSYKKFNAKLEGKIGLSHGYGDNLIVASKIMIRLKMVPGSTWWKNTKQIVRVIGDMKKVL